MKIYNRHLGIFNSCDNKFSENLNYLVFLNYRWYDKNKDFEKE